MNRQEREQEATADAVRLELIEPLAGFTEHRNFALVPLDDHGALWTLRATDGPGLSFLVASPQAFFPSYAPLIEDVTLSILDIRDERDLMLLVLVHPAAVRADSTANLLAPLVVNRRTQRGAQVVLDDTALSLRTSLDAA